jgi:uncharacterized membrane protein YdjX (TVP38/TMEM64 family)
MEENKKEQEITKTEKKELIRNLIILAIVIGVVIGISLWLDIDKAREYITLAGIWAPLVLIALKASTIIFAPLSGSPIYPLAGVFFGPVWGSIYVILGDILGGVVSFFLSRILGRKIVDKVLSKKELGFVSKILHTIETPKGFFIARLLFATMPEISSYAAGLTKLKFLPFVIIHTLIGIIPAVLLVGIGSSFAFVNTPLGMFSLLALGTIIVGLGGFIFIKYVEPKLLKKTDL